MKGHPQLATRTSGEAEAKKAATPAIDLAFLGSQAHRANRTLWLKQHQLFASIGFILAITNRIVDGFLLQALDKKNERELAIALITCILLSCTIGVLALQHCYCAWGPRSMRNFICGLFVLPLSTPELMALLWRTDYIDHVLLFLGAANLTLIEGTAALIGIAFAFQEGLRQIVVIKFACTLAAATWAVFTVHSHELTIAETWQRFISVNLIKPFSKKVAPKETLELGDVA